MCRNPCPEAASGPGRALNGVHDAVEEVAHADLVRREQEHRDRERGQDDEVDRAVDRDDAQHDPVAQRLPAQRQLDLVTRGGGVSRAGLSGGGSGIHESQRTQRYQRTPSLLACDDGVLGPQPRRVGADQLVTAHAADEQLPVEARPEAARLLRARWPVHRRGC